MAQDTRQPNYALMAKTRLNRLPTERDEFDQCLSFLKNKVYWCVKIDRRWYLFPFWNDSRRENEAFISALGSYDGGSYTEVEDDGTLEFKGQGTVWDDIRVPLSSIKRLGFSDPDWVQFQDDGAGSTGVYAPAFDKTTDEEVYFSCQLPHSWKLGTDLNPHIHWAPSDADTGSVTWKIEYTIAEINGTFGNTSTISVTDAGDGTALKHQYADMPDIDMSSYVDTGNVSITLLCRLYRDVSDADDYDADAFLLEVDFHYQIDTVGSRKEKEKF